MNQKHRPSIIIIIRLTMAVDTQTSFFNSLYCEEDDEEKWGEIEDENDPEIALNDTLLSPLLEQDLFWDDEELQSLFSKEKETCFVFDKTRFSVSVSSARKEAVEWMLKINAHYGFSALTAILAVNYLDRFLTTLNFQEDDDKNKQPWMMQLSAVTCLSLAAKVEETYVPLLLDLQVEGTKYVFEAKTIQRMEVLVLSSLKWRMNPVTPLSFLDHIIRRLGLKSYLHWEFLDNSQNLLLSVISDSRVMNYLPSVLATATMLHVIHQVEPCNAIHYENQLLGVLKISKEEVDDCYELISETLSKSVALKRKFWQLEELNMSSCDDDDDNGSNDSCISSHDNEIIKCNNWKKSRRVQEQQMKLPSFSRVFVD